jgi:DNA-directed RNA polymerase specialized sigma24 family protein
MLDPDPGRAATKYAQLRLKLIWVIEGRIQGKGSAGDLADEAIERAVMKIYSGETIHNIYTYTRGVARKVVQEHWDRIKSEADSLAGLEAYAIADSQAQADEVWLSELKHECMLSCLKSLPPEKRDLLVGYYQQGKHSKRYRDELAAEMECSRDALNLKVGRLKNKLGRCFADCVRKGTAN